MINSNFKKITNKTFLFNDFDQSFILKEQTDKSNEIYSYIKSQNIDNILTPIDSIDLENHKYYKLPFIEDINYPLSKKVHDLKEELSTIHRKTAITKKIKKAEIKKFYQISLILNNKFQLLDELVVSSELEENKTDYNWVILSKYNIILECKKHMYYIQKRITNYISQNESVIYTLNHGLPFINHLINKKIISIDKAKIGIVSSDIAKFYICNEYINIDWNTFINSWLEEYNKDIYKDHFQFLVLFVFILNIKIDSNSYETMTSYLQITMKIKKFLVFFRPPQKPPQ